MKNTHQLSTILFPHPFFPHILSLNSTQLPLFYFSKNPRPKYTNIIYSQKCIFLLSLKLDNKKNQWRVHQRRSERKKNPINVELKANQSFFLSSFKKMYLQHFKDFSRRTTFPNFVSFSLY